MLKNIYDYFMVFLVNNIGKVALALLLSLLLIMNLQINNLKSNIIHQDMTIHKIAKAIDKNSISDLQISNQLDSLHNDVVSLKTDIDKEIVLNHHLMLNIKSLEFKHFKHKKLRMSKHLHKIC